ncbi:MAG TPA: FAD-dependent oxidoreductase [Candidatus Binatia bacterium]|jgi:selenide,water dikinase
MNATRRRVVLVGAGHAHIEVLRRWSLAAPPGATLTLVVDRDCATYSGMVPGVVAGDYRVDQAEIPVAPLASRAGADLVIDVAARIDARSRTVETAGGRAIAYDVASIDIGSSVAGLDLPGVREHALATRPVAHLAGEIDRCLAARSGVATRVAVVGGGAAGVELSFTLEARLAHLGSRREVFLICEREGLLPTYPARVRAVAARLASRRGIRIEATRRVTAVNEHGLVFEDGTLPAELVVWATGAAPPALLADSELVRDARGFVRVAPTLEVVGQRGLFAVGDCASIDGAEWVPKAGVHAVREAPVLDANLRAALAGHPLQHYRPQRDFLSLINLGHRRALAAKWGFVVTGRLLWLLKDRIDRGFVAKYRV